MSDWIGLDWITFGKTLTRQVDVLSMIFISAVHSSIFNFKMMSLAASLQSPESVQRDFSSELTANISVKLKNYSYILFAHG